MKMLPVVGPSPLSVNPIFEIGLLEPHYSKWLVFEGVYVDEKDQHYLGSHVLCSICPLHVFNMPLRSTKRERFET
jgi:hypothetical protein